MPLLDMPFLDVPFLDTHGPMPFLDTHGPGTSRFADTHSIRGHA
jgi:hypothetical protein